MARSSIGLSLLDSFYRAGQQTNNPAKGLKSSFIKPSPFQKNKVSIKAQQTQPIQTFPPLRYNKFSACRSWMRPEGSKRAIPIHSALLVRDITLSTALTVFHPLTRGKELQIHFVRRRKHALSRTAAVVSCVGLGCQEQHRRL